MILSNVEKRIKARKPTTLGNKLIVTTLFVLAFLSLYPMWYTFIISLSDSAAVDSGRVWFLPIGLNFEAYKRILDDKTFLNAFWVSVKRAVVGCSLNMVLLVLIGYPLSLPEDKFPAGKFYRWFLVANMLFSGGLIPMFTLMKMYNLFDSFWAMILPGAVGVWSAIMMANFFKNVPFELHEAAAIDGANPLQIMSKIYVPLSIPSLACMLLMFFVGHWNSYFDGLVYINDINKQPLQTYIYQLSATVDMQSMTSEEILELMSVSSASFNAAKVVLAMLPILCIYPILQRYFVTGMNLGGIKE